ncbi:hypothetical protein CSAL01_06382 [Colletotrichum salicis]|uniref:ABC transporter n=1 Tax=Colletotrichum salicis TaxID=1209931 RepID=A0A135UKH8_9PEZI|nr:hypothetical protein CSAL01_06382 [Colletotrichum salicis]
MDTNVSCASPGDPGDSAFGPVMDPCVRKFDFPLLFEDTILSILPSSIFIILAALRILSRRSVQHKVANNTFSLVKLGSILVFTAISVALTALWARDADLALNNKTAIAAAALTILDSVFVAGLSFTEHSRSLSPSLLLNAFLVLSTIFDAEEASKRRWIIGDSSECSSEETAGLFNRVGFHWLNSLLLNGFNSPLSIDKLPVIDRQLLSDSLWNRVGQKWRNPPKTGNNALLGTIFSALKWPMLAPVPAYMILVGLQLAQPFMISTIMAYLASPGDHAEDQRNIGYELIGAYDLVYISIAKTTSMSITGAEEAAAVTLMSTDIERIVNGMSKIYESWSTLLQMAVALALLYRQVGVVFIVPHVLFLICAVGAGALSGSAGTFQASWMAAMQKRVGMTITSILPFSYLGAHCSLLTFEPFRSGHFFCFGSSQRRQAVRFHRQDVLNHPRPALEGNRVRGKVQDHATRDCHSVLTQHGDHTTLDSNRIFTSLALLALVTQPLNELFAHLPNIIASIACFGRVQAFLLSPETAAKSDVCSPSDNTRNTSSVSESQRDSSLRQELEKQPKFNETTILDPLVSGNAIEIRNAKFSWKADADPALTKPHVGHPPRKAHNDCRSQGTINRASDNIAFCDQVPWLTNETLPRDVTGFSHFEASWYSTVVRARSLEEDIATFPDGDQVMIGSKGVTLSGGQNPFQAIARAVYSRRDIILFDDVFSGLDFETQTRVFNNLFGVSGLLRQRNVTALFLTHAVHILPQADYIITLDQTGTIASRGTFEELNKQPGYISKFSLVTKEDTVQRDAVKDDSNSAFKPEQREKTANSSIGEETQRMGDRSVYKYYFQATGHRSVLIFITLQIIWVFLTKFPEIWLSWWDEANDRHPNQETGKYVGVYATPQVLSLVALAATCWAPLSFFATTNTGSIVNRFSQDIQLIDAELPISLLNVAANGLICIAQALMIIPVSYQLIAVFPFLGGVLWVIQRFYLRTSRQLRFLELDAKAPMTSRTSCETASTPPRSQRIFSTASSAGSPSSLTSPLPPSPSSSSPSPSPCAGFAGVALYNIMGLSSAMKAAITVWTVLETSIGAVARVKTFAEQTPAESQAQEPKTPSGSWPERWAISFHNVTASYGEGMENVLSKVSFSSSLLLTLLRLIDCNEGQVIVDGVDVATMPREVLRQRLNALPQEPPFFSGSVRLNCDPQGTISDEIITEALRAVGLWEVIEEKGGLDVEFSDDFFSHGQKQVFCLARGILRPSKIVVMDEATSSVDVDTEKKMMKLIHERFADATIISVAHCLDTVLDFDKIIILDKGVIVEEGCPAELLGRASVFRSLYETFHT